MTLKRSILSIGIALASQFASAQVFIDSFDRPDGEDINASQEGTSGSAAPLQYVVQQAVIESGYSSAEIVEIVANVALNIFTNYFNHVAETEIDFPHVSSHISAIS